VLQNDGKKKYIIQENAKRLAVKKIENGECWEETGAANLEKNTHTCTCTKKRKRIGQQGSRTSETGTEKRTTIANATHT